MLTVTVRAWVRSGHQKCPSKRPTTVNLLRDLAPYHLIFAGDSADNSLKSLVLRVDGYLHPTPDWRPIAPLQDRMRPAKYIFSR
jgi:hypothetical protein